MYHIPNIIIKNIEYQHERLLLHYYVVVVDGKKKTKYLLVWLLHFLYLHSRNESLFSKVLCFWIE